VDAVSAGEILEHVADPSTVVSEACRILRPAASCADTVNATWLAVHRVTPSERIPGLAPKGIHDPKARAARADPRPTRLQRR
jgi:2-polyprenyl-6-hydroxyphenyl methylase/3-demethylubiquinone-9 3-methyltransferase